MKLKSIAFAAVLCLALLLAAAALGATTGVFDVEWWTAESGGHSSGSGAAGLFELNGTLGQADAAQLSGANYELSGGFWSGGAAAGQKLYLPLLVGKGSAQ